MARKDSFAAATIEIIGYPTLVTELAELAAPVWRFEPPTDQITSLYATVSVRSSGSMKSWSIAPRYAYIASRPTLSLPPVDVSDAGPALTPYHWLWSQLELLLPQEVYGPLRGEYNRRNAAHTAAYARSRKEK